MYSNDDPGLALVYFKARSNLVPVCICKGPCLSCRFPRNCWNLWGESCYIQSNKGVHDGLWHPKVKVIQWPLCKVTQIQHFQTSFPQKHKAVRSQISYRAIMGCWEENLFKYSGSHDQDGFQAIYGKNLKNLLLQNQEADDLETWYTAMGTQVLPKCVQWWHWVDHDHFYDMVKGVDTRMPIIGPVDCQKSKLFNIIPSEQIFSAHLISLLFD